MGRTAACGICGHNRLKPILDLGDQPMAERDDGNLYPLSLLECELCGLVQLSYVVDQRELFPEDHPYSTGNTAALRRHFRGQAARLAPLLEPGDLVVDIGCNDGTFLGELATLAPRANLLGVEPTGQAEKCRARGIPVVQDFFTARLARRLVKSFGQARYITASNVLAHVPDPHDFMTGVSTLLEPVYGEFITENHDWASVINGLQIDTVYHEHLRYYSIASLSHLLAMHGFLVRSATPLPTHGGSFRVTARPQRRGLAVRAQDARDQLRALLRGLITDRLLPASIYGIGAATRATPLIHYAGLEDFLTCVVEVPGSDKIGRTMPGTALPIMDEKVLLQNQPPYALIFPWHLASSIVPALRAAGYEGKFIVPLPYPEVLDD